MEAFKHITYNHFTLLCSCQFPFMLYQVLQRLQRLQRFTNVYKRTNVYSVLRVIQGII